MEWDILLFAQTEELAFRNRIENFKFIDAPCDEILVFATLLGEFRLQSEAREAEEFFFRAGPYINFLGFFIFLGRYARLLVLVVPLRTNVTIVVILNILVNVIKDLTCFRRSDALSIETAGLFEGHNLIFIRSIDIYVALAVHLYQRAFFNDFMLISAEP